MNESVRPQSTEGSDAARGHGLAGAAAEHLREVLQAAERAAAGILQDAEAEAKRQIEDSRRHAEQLAMERIRRMAELTDDLVERAEAVKERSERLLEALEGTATELERERPSAEPPLRSVEPLRPVGTPPAGVRGETTPGTAGRSRRTEGISKEAALLLATQMAVAGSSREEIERRLRDDLGIESPAEILDGALDADRRG